MKAFSKNHAFAWLSLPRTSRKSVFNPLTILSLIGNLFNTILQTFLHRLMVKVYFGLVCQWHSIGLDRPRSRDFRHFDPSLRISSKIYGLSKKFCFKITGKYIFSKIQARDFLHMLLFLN